jgi:hypothetical protein
VVVDSQSDILISSASLPAVVDAPVAIVGSLDFSAVALGLQASSVVESFEAKPPDLAAWEVGLMGVVVVCSHQSARLAAKCVEGPSSFWFPVVASQARCSRSGTWLTQGCVLRISVLDSSLLLLSIALTCMVDFTTRMWRLFLVVLDVTSSRFRSRGATSWVCAGLLACVPKLSCLFPFFFFFYLCLS